MSVVLLHPIIGRLQTTWWWDAVPSSTVHLASALFAWRDLTLFVLVVQVSLVCCQFWWTLSVLAVQWTLSVLAVQVSILLFLLGTSMMLYFFHGPSSRLLSVFTVLQRSDLQKPRLRVRSQLTNLQRDIAEELLPPASISSSELKLTALVISHAILNPWEDVTEWDIDRFAEPMRNVADKTKYFPYPQWGHISDPAMVLDVHGRVLVWYLPGIIPPARVEHLNEIHIPLKDSLVKCSKTGGQSKRRFGHKHVPEEDGNEKFGHGRLMNSPATFQQAHMEYFWRLIHPQRLEDQVYESSSLKKPAILPELARRLYQAALDVIVNQETPPHQDQASAPSLLDLVPGTMVFLAGKLLTHSVPKWEKGERIALAHYMNDAIHNRFGLARPMFTQHKDLLGALPVFHIDPEEHALKKVQSPVQSLCPPRPEGESSPTKKWMLGTSTSHLAVCLPLHKLQEPWHPPKISTSLTFPTLLTSLTLTGMMQKIPPSPEGTQRGSSWPRQEFVSSVKRQKEVSSACPALESMPGVAPVLSKLTGTSPFTRSKGGMVLMSSVTHLHIPL
ncbi:hypothetical protein EDC04DRAFT_2608977 [Pisolithus marmoratus]|nr:hypothetical protein EDC04DRAFT_2608977 [Pisolithus marmoratus]